MHILVGTRLEWALSQKNKGWFTIGAINTKGVTNMISFKWRHFKQDIILMLVRWYLAYSLSYRDVEELALERGLKGKRAINPLLYRHAQVR